MYVCKLVCVILFKHSLFFAKQLKMFSAWMKSTKAMMLLSLICYVFAAMTGLIFHCIELIISNSTWGNWKFSRILEILIGVGSKLDVVNALFALYLLFYKP